MSRPGRSFIESMATTRGVSGPSVILRPSSVSTTLPWTRIQSSSATWLVWKRADSPVLIGPISMSIGLSLPNVVVSVNETSSSGSPKCNLVTSHGSLGFACSGTVPRTAFESIIVVPDLVATAKFPTSNPPSSVVHRDRLPVCSPERLNPDRFRRSIRHANNPILSLLGVLSVGVFVTGMGLMTFINPLIALQSLLEFAR